MPEPLTVSTNALSEDQPAHVTFCVEPSENVPVATICVVAFGMVRTPLESRTDCRERVGGVGVAGVVGVMGVVGDVGLPLLPQATSAEIATRTTINFLTDSNLPSLLRVAGRPPFAPFTLTAAVLALDFAQPPRRPNATAAGFFFFTKTI